MSILCGIAFSFNGLKCNRGDEPGAKRRRIDANKEVWDLACHTRYPLVMLDYRMFILKSTWTTCMILRPQRALFLRCKIDNDILKARWQALPQWRMQLER